MKKLAFLLALVLMASAAGCAKTPATTTDPASQSAASGSTASEADTASGEKIKISWLIAGDQTPYKDDNPVKQAIEAHFPNLDLTVLKINGADAEKLNATLSAGNIPDVLVRWDIPKMYEDGVIRGITKEMMETNMPKTVAAMKDATGEAMWTKMINPLDGTLMAVPQFSIAGDAKLVEIVRKDWLDNLGMTVPATLDEYHEMLRRFTFDDPDGNGKDDTYGLGAAGMHPSPMSAHFYYAFGAYGVEPAQWQEVDGSVQYTSFTEPYKEALKTLQSWYNEGLIDREWATTQNTDAINKLLNGVYGTYYAHPSYLDPNNPNGWIALSKENNPDCEFEIIPPVTGPDGKFGTRSYGMLGDWGIMFGIKTTDEQVELAMQVADLLNSDVDLFRLAFYGVEGEHYTMTDGVVTPNPGIVEAENGIKCFRTASYINWDIFKVFTAPDLVALNQKCIDYQLIPSAVDRNQVKMVAADAADNTEIDKLELEFYFDAITGKVDIDAQWPKYLETYKALGGDALTEAANNLPRLDK